MSWGAASWQEDLGEAAKQAESWLSQVAGARGWPVALTQGLAYAIAEAQEEADNLFSDDIPGFWVDLRRRAEKVRKAWEAAGNTAPAGFDKLLVAWGAAAGATETAEASRKEGSAATIIGGTIAGSIADVRKAVNPKKSPLPWLLGLGLLAFILYKVKS
jgi:hypothetical protein